MGKYLGKFASVLPAVQGKQIYNMLTDLHRQGTITTFEEYNKKLQELAYALKNSTPIPTFKLLEALIGSLVSSDRYNAMAGSVINDLVATFKEADEIATVLELHKQIYKLTVLESFQQAVNSLRNKIALYEFVANSIDKWKYSQYNTFDTPSAYGLERTSATQHLFRDERQLIRLDSENDCSVDTVGQQLIMPIRESVEYKVASVSLVESASSTSPPEDLAPDSDISNLIDQQQQTHWIYAVLMPDRQDLGARIRIKLDLGSIKDFNIIQLEPVYPMTLYQIFYQNPDQSYTYLSYNSLIAEKTSYYLERCEARYIYIDLIQKDCIPNQSTMTSTEDKEIQVAKAASTQQIQELVSIDTETPEVELAGYEYRFALDNIRVFLNKYNNLGVYLTQPQRVTGLGLIGLATDEENISTPYLRGAAEIQQYSFEYNIQKIDYNSIGAPIRAAFVPILPLGSSSDIVDERLYLVTRSGGSVLDTAKLRFPLKPASGSTQCLHVYRDLVTELAPGGSDGNFQVRVAGGTWRDSWANINTDLVNAAGLYAPLVVEIKLLSPSPTSVYTVSYTVNTSEGDKYTRLAPDIVLKNNLTLEIIPSQVTDVVESEIYMVCYMRSNATDSSQTCALREYKLLYSTFDDERFSE